MVYPYVKQIKVLMSHSTGIEYMIWDFSNCKTEDVVYMCACQCPCDYVEKMKRQFRLRKGDHIGDIRPKRDTPIAQYIWEYHGGDYSEFKFMVIEMVCPSSRKGDWDKRILRKDTEWIYRIKSMHP